MRPPQVNQHDVQRALSLVDQLLCFACSPVEVRRRVERILARCVTEASRDGAPVDAADLPPDVLDAVADAIAAADQAADLRLRASCPSCGEEHATRLDVAGFFLAELTGWHPTLETIAAQAALATVYVAGAVWTFYVIPRRIRRAAVVAEGRRIGSPTGA